LADEVEELEHEHCAVAACELIASGTFQSVSGGVASSGERNRTAVRARSRYRDVSRGIE
jgi:hypothetical protein